MEFATDNLIARALLTLNTLGYSLVPVFADFNKTHATNPLWTPHARFHVVWQVTSYCGIGLIALALIWTAGPSAQALARGGARGRDVCGLLRDAVLDAALRRQRRRHQRRSADRDGADRRQAARARYQRTVFCVQVAILLVAMLLIR